jgi:hypothetical protein
MMRFLSSDTETTLFPSLLYFTDQTWQQKINIRVMQTGEDGRESSETLARGENLHWLLGSVLEEHPTTMSQTPS